MRFDIRLAKYPELAEKISQFMIENDRTIQSAGIIILREFFKDKDKKEEQKKEAVTQKTKAPVKRFVKPTWEEVAKYFYEQGSQTCQDDATRFIDHYTANGWKVGKNAMKDWKATVRTWMKRKDDDGQSGSKAISCKSNGAGYDRDSTDW